MGPHTLCILANGLRRCLTKPWDVTEWLYLAPVFLLTKNVHFNPLMGTGNYSAISNNMKLVH